MIRVAIADDHLEMRAALRLLLRLSEDIQLIYEAGDGQEALDCVKRLQPDVLVMDIYMPVLDGLDVTRQITALGVPTRVILISLDTGSFIVMQAIAAGAHGFVPKDNLAASLLQAIKTVHQGETFFEH